MIRKTILFSCLLAFLTVPCLWAQEDSFDTYDDLGGFDQFDQEESFAPAQPLTQGTASAPQQTITLKDGTILKGRLTGVMDNVYMIETKNLGTVPVDISKVSNISAGSSTLSSLGSSPALPGMGAGGLGGMSGGMGMRSAPMQQIQQDILSDPSMMADIQKMMTDPELMALIADGNLMNSIMSMDPAQAQNDPRIQKLMQNPTMQRFIQKVQQKYSAPASQGY